MAAGPRLIIQVARDGAVDRQLRARPSPSAASGEVVVESTQADEAGHLQAPGAGEVVLSVPSPQTLLREREQMRRVLDQAGQGVQPLVVVVEAAEELRDEELAAVLEAAERAARPVILRVMRDA